MASETVFQPAWATDKDLKPQQQFAKRGQVELFVAALAGLDIDSDAEQPWNSAMLIGQKLVELGQMRGMPTTSGPSRWDKIQTAVICTHKTIVQKHKDSAGNGLRRSAVAQFVRSE